MVAKKGVKASEEDLARVPLQAIIIADSSTTKFEPITLECPKVLLPLVNTPMIDYTLAWLESAGVEEVFVLCCSHPKQIVNYLCNSKWVNKPNFSVTTIESHNRASAGDALRVIYERKVIQGDFILVSGDTVSNIMLAQAIQEHNERKGKDKDAIMTMVITQKPELKPCHVPRDKLVVGIDHTTNELLCYLDEADDINFENSYVAIHPCFTLHNDKQDCYIDICSPQVLSLFMDNYDYQRLRGDFVKGLLVDGRVGFKIFTHEIHSSCYATRIDSFGSYDLISKDIIQRRLAPGVQFSMDNDEYANDGIITDNNLENGVVSDMGEDGRGFIWSMSEVDHVEERRPEFDAKSHHQIFEESVETIFLGAVHADAKYRHFYTLRKLQSLHINFGLDPADCAAALLCSIMKLALDTSKNSGNDLAKEMNAVISKWGSLVKPFSLGIDEKVEVILRLEEMCLKEYAPLFAQVLCILYDIDIIQQEAILNWANDKGRADEFFVKQSEMFIQRL